VGDVLMGQPVTGVGPSGIGGSDRSFLPLLFDADPRPFHGVMPYRDGRMLSWTYTRI